MQARSGGSVTSCLEKNRLKSMTCEHSTAGAECGSGSEEKESRPGQEA